MFDHTTDIAQVKRFNSALITLPVPLSTFFDHFRLLLYRLLDNGAASLEFTSDPFDSTGAEVELEFSDANDAANFVAAIEDNKFYRLDVVAYDAGETQNAVEDEHFLHAVPDVINTISPLTSGAGGTGTGAALDDAIDSLVIEKSLALSGHNVLHGEFNNANGYTTKRIIRGYEVLTDAEADALLAASDDPGEAEIIFKHETTKTVADNGNEVAALARELPLS